MSAGLPGGQVAALIAEQTRLARKLVDERREHAEALAAYRAEVDRLRDQLADAVEQRDTWQATADAWEGAAERIADERDSAHRALRIGAVEAAPDA